MKKVTDFIKKNYIMICIIIAVFLVIVGSIILINIIKDNINKIETKKESYGFYEYFEKDKKTFDATLHFEDDKIVKIDSKDYKVYENSFIYYQDKSKIILPKDMSIVFYNRSNLSYKLARYSEIENEDNANIIYTEGQKVLNDDFFIYDGEDLYFFITDVTLKVGKEEIPLSKYSYVYARSNDLMYLDYAKDEAKVIDNVSVASVKVGNVVIDLMKDATVLNNNVIVLETNLANMPLYKEDKNEG